MEKLSKVVLNAIFWSACAALFITPALMSAKCYSHYGAPKDFAVYAGSGVLCLLMSVFIISRMFFTVREKFTAPGAAVILFSFVIFSFLSLFNSMSEGLTYIKLLYFSCLFSWFAVFYLLSADRSRVEKMLMCIVLSGVFPAAVIVLEFIGIRFMDAWNNIGPSGLAGTVAYASTLGDAAAAAPFFGLLALLNIRNFIYSEKPYQMFMYGVLEFLYIAAWLIPMTRSSQIAFAVSASLYFFLVRRFAPGRAVSFVNIIILIFIAASAIQFKDMFSQANETFLTRAFGMFFNARTSAERLYMLSAGWEMICENPLLGSGANTMLLIFPIYAAKAYQGAGMFNMVPFNFNPQHLHNEFINIAAECGIITLSAYAAAIAAILYAGLKSVVKKGEKHELSAILSCAVIFVMVDSMFNITLTFSHLNLILFAALAFLAAVSDNEKRHMINFEFSNRFARLFIVWLLIMFSLFSSIFAFKYINSETCLMRGRMEELSGMRVEALSSYASSISLYPFRAEPYFFSSEINREDGEFERAIENLKAASNVNLSLPIVYSLARLAIRHMDLNSEFRYLFHLTKLYPRFDEPYYLLGLRYLKEKTKNPEALDLALGSFDGAIKLNEKHIGARMSKAEIYYEKRMYPAAIAEIDKVLSIEPGLKNALYLKSLMKGFFF